MKRRTFLRGSAAALPIVAELARPAPSSAQGLQPITLPKPQTQGGKPLMQALSQRKTGRNIGEQKFSAQVLSNLLWAAFGVNREDGRRTAPSAMNVRDIDIYVFMAEGVYLYDAAAHALKPVLAGDSRAKTGTQPAVATAPACLLYVADYDKYNTGRGPGLTDQSVMTAWSNAHVGFIAQNVYLYAASEDLASWFRARIDNEGLAKFLSLRPAQKVLYAQTVGYPVKSA